MASELLILPNLDIFYFYEGGDRTKFTPATGKNFNNAPVALLENVNFLNEKLSALIIGADVWDPLITYKKFSLVRMSESSKNMYISQSNDNLDNDPSTDDGTNWVSSSSAYINDSIVSSETVWSSKRTQDEILAMAIALG